MITVGSLFAGVGGIDLGLEWTGGFKTVWQVEIDPYATRVLEKHWPTVKRWGDVRTFPPEPVDQWRCDLICGGFPCQDISEAGNKAGIDGERSGLWREYCRVLSVLRPRFAIVENSASLPIRGLYRIIGDLTAIGYDAEWQTLSARTFGAPHLRRRTFTICYPNVRGRPTIMDAKKLKAREKPHKRHWWDAEPGVPRVADWAPVVVDRLERTGNAVVPQVAQWIGERILEADQAT